MSSQNWLDILIYQFHRDTFVWYTMCYTHVRISNNLYGKAKDTALAIKRLEDIGGIIVGKIKTAA